MFPLTALSSVGIMRPIPAFRPARHGSRRAAGRGVEHTRAPGNAATGPQPGAARRTKGEGRVRDAEPGIGHAEGACRLSPEDDVAQDAPQIGDTVTNRSQHSRGLASPIHLAVLALLAGAAAAQAQTAGPAAAASAAKPDNGEVQQVTVTATKRTTSLQETPLAVTSI